MDKEKFHNLLGEKIYFRKMTEDDVKEIHSYASDKIVNKYIGWPLTTTIQETKEYISEMLSREEKDTFLYTSILTKDTHKVVGTAMVFSFNKEAKHCEIGYVFNRDYWGNGYGTEAIKLMDEYVFDALDSNKSYASVISGNIGSCKVLEKNGYSIEARLKEHIFIDGKYHDLLKYSKFKVKNCNYRLR